MRVRTAAVSTMMFPSRLSLCDCHSRDNSGLPLSFGHDFVCQYREIACQVDEMSFSKASGSSGSNHFLVKQAAQFLNHTMFDFSQ